MTLTIRISGVGVSFNEIDVFIVVHATFPKLSIWGEAILSGKGVQ